MDHPYQGGSPLFHHIFEEGFRTRPLLDKTLLKGEIQKALPLLWRLNLVRNPMIIPIKIPWAMEM